MMPFWLDDVRCNGSESRIDQCPRDATAPSWGYGIHNCDKNEAAELDCNPENDGFTTPGPYRSRGPYRTRGANRTRGSYRTRGPYHNFTTTPGPYPNSKLSIS